MEESKLVITPIYTLSKGPESENKLIFCVRAIVFEIQAILKIGNENRRQSAILNSAMPKVNRVLKDDPQKPHVKFYDNMSRHFNSRAITRKSQRWPPVGHLELADAQNQ